MSTKLSKRLQNIIDERQRADVEFKTTLIDAIKSIPENPKIRPVGQPGSRCFIVRSSDIGQNWTPIYHSFDLQKEKLCAEIQRKNSETILPWLGEILETQKLKRGDGTSLTLNPEFIKAIQSTMNQASA